MGTNAASVDGRVQTLSGDFQATLPSFLFIFSCPEPELGVAAGVTDLKSIALDA